MNLIVKQHTSMQHDYKNKQLKNSVLPLFWRNWRGSEWCEHDTLCCLIDGSRSLTLREKTEDFVYLRLQPFQPLIHIISRIYPSH